MRIRFAKWLGVATLGLGLVLPVVAGAQDAPPAPPPPPPAPAPKPDEPKPAPPAPAGAAKEYPKAATPEDLFKHVKEAMVQKDGKGFIHYMAKDTRVELEKQMTQVQEQLKTPPEGMDANAMSMMIFGIAAAEATKMTPLDLAAHSISQIPEPEVEKLKKVEVKEVKYGEDGKGDAATATVATITTTEEEGQPIKAVKEEGEWRMAM